MCYNEGSACIACIDYYDIASISIHVATILFDIFGGAKDHATTEKVVAQACASATLTTSRVGHLNGFAEPAPNTTPSLMPASACYSTEIPPAAITYYALAHLYPLNLR